MTEKKFGFFLIIALLIMQAGYAQDLKMVLPIGHTDKLYEARFSPDGKRVITASKDKTAKIWDATSGFLLADLKGHTEPVTGAQFSPDGKLAVTVSLNNEEMTGHIKVWDAAHGTMKAEPEKILTWVNAFGFSADSKKIFVVSDSVICWDAVSGNWLFSIAKKGINASQVSFSPNGKWMLFADEDPALKICDAQSGAIKFTCTGFSAPVAAVYFSADGRRLVAATANETISWDTQTWKPVGKVAGRILFQDLFFFSADKRFIITADYSPQKQNISVWNAATRKLISVKKGRLLPDKFGHISSSDTEPGGLRGTAAAAASDKLAAVINATYHSRSQLFANNDKTAFLWNLNNVTGTDTLNGHTKAINFIQFSTDGKKLVTASDDGTAKVWDAADGHLLTDLRGHTFGAASAAFSPATADDPAGGKWMVTTSDDGSLKIWDPVTLKLKNIFQGPAEKLYSVQYSSNGKKLVADSKEGNMTVWDAGTGQARRFEHVSDVKVDPTSEQDLEEVTGLVPSVLSPDGSKVLTAIQGNSALLFDANSGKLLFSFKNERFPGAWFLHFSPDGSKIIAGWRYYDHEKDAIEKNCIIADVLTGKILFKLNAEDAQFSPDSRKIIAMAGFGNIIVLDAETGSTFYGLSKGTAGEIAELLPVFSPDGMKIFAYDWHDSIAGFWDAANGQFLNRLKGIVTVNTAAFSADGKQLLITAGTGEASLWNVETGQSIAALTGHTGKIRYAGFSPDSKRILTTSNDFTAKIWDVSTGQCITTFFAVDSAENFAQLPSGYYQSTPQASKQLHYVTHDLDAVSFEQLDVKYNRPDLVLAAIGRADTNLISTYRNAYRKRLKKLGISEAALRDGYNVPDAEIVNRNEIATEQSTGMLSLHIKGADLTTALDRLNIWVNEVPVFGQRGYYLGARHSRELDTMISIQLTQGENRIETSVTNIAGAESYRQPLLLNYMSEKPQPEKIWFIGIGMDRFADSSHNLHYCSKDIRDLSAKMKKKYAGNIVIDTLLNEQVNIASVQALKQVLMQTSVNDKVILAYSGHGLLSKDLDYYLSTYRVNFSKPEENGLPYDVLEDLLDSIPARKKLMLIDACHSGEVDKESVVITKPGDEQTVKAEAGSKGGDVRNLSSGSRLGLKNSYELMQDLFVNVGRSTGATIISAAAGTELAQENGELKNGVFTYCLMEAMDKYPAIKISELRKIVGARVTALTKGLQKPTSRNEPVAADWSL